jgi:hypothetical protein
MNKTFRACSYLHVSCVLGRVLPLSCDDCRPSLVGGSFEVHDPPASPTPSGNLPSGLRNTKLVFMTIVFVSVLSCLKCASCFRARGAHATRTPPCSTRLPRVQTAATSALSPPRSHPPLSLAPQAQSLPTPRSPPGPARSMFMYTSRHPALCTSRDPPSRSSSTAYTLSALRRYSGDDARSRHFLGLVAGQAVTALAA